MTKIDILSGFLGAGKTTLIKKLIAEGYKNQKLVLIENEFGEIGIDGGFLKDAGVTVNEMNSGCICCSLVGDFGLALQKVLNEFAPDRIIIEPSGVGKLSDIIRAVEELEMEGVTLNLAATVVDVNKCKMYMKNFGEFFNNQIEHAGTIVLSHTSNVTDEKLHTCEELLRQHNADAAILTTPWQQLSGEQILAFMEKGGCGLQDELKALEADVHHHHEEHHHHDHGEECSCGCHHGHEDHDKDCCDHHEHHHHDEECHCHDHEHHHHDEECHCHDHEHHHHDKDCHCHDHEHHNEHCSCGHHHHHHHHHHADEVFTSFGAETGRKYTVAELQAALAALTDEERYGTVLRAKGIVAGEEGFIHFDYVPGEPDVRLGSPEPTGRLCIIGSGIKEDALKELFQI